MTDPLRITLVTKRPCIRLTKQAYALKGIGHTVNLVSPMMDSDHAYTHILYWKTPASLANAIRLVSHETDIFVVHNEPTWPLLIIRETLPNAKIVLEYHDSTYWYFDVEHEYVAPNEKASWYEEDYCVALADGFVVGSESSRNELRTRTDHPIAVVPPACIQGDYRYWSMPFKGGLVSQGGHSVPGLYNRLAAHWRDYTKLYKYLKGKCRVVVYTPDYKPDDKDSAVKKHYGSLVDWIDAVPYDQLLNEIGQCSWNLVGNWVQHFVWQYSAPNKFYDALAAGTPSVVFHIKSIEEAILEDGMGIYVDHPDELLDQWEKHHECRKNVMLKRSKYSMERFIGRAVDLYREVLHG